MGAAQAFADLGADVVELAPWTPPADAAPLREVAFRANAWTPQEEADLVDLFHQGLSLDYMALSFGRTRDALQDRMWRLGLRRRVSLPWSALDDEELGRRYGQEPASRIAQDLGRSVQSVYVRAQMLGLSEPNPPPWEPWEDAQLAAGYAAGIPPAQLAALIGRPLAGLVSRASKQGLRHPNHPPGWSDDEMARALALAEEGHRYLAIIEQLVAEGFPRRTKNGFGQRIRILGYGRGWGREWTAEEDDLLRKAYADGASLTPLQSRLGRTAGSFRWRAEHLGIRGSHPKPDGWRGRIWTPEEEAILREGYGKRPKADLLADLDRDWSAIQVRAAHLGIKHGWMRALTEDDVLAIQIAWRHGISTTDLAQALNRQIRVPWQWGKRNGFSFGDPSRPKAPRYPLGSAKRQTWTLASILALEGRTPNPDSPIAPTKARGKASPPQKAAMAARDSLEAAA